MSDRPLVLLYNIDPGRKINLLAAAAKLRIQVREVSISEYAMPLSDLVEQKPVGVHTFEGNAFTEPMLLMANFTGPLLNSLLNMLRASRMKPIGLKAMLTPTNAEWNSIQLHDAILSEHIEMNRKKAPRA